MILSAVLCACSPGGTRNKTADKPEGAELSFFGDTMRCHDRRSVEREVVRLLTAMQQGSEEEARRHMGELLRAAARDSVAFGLTTDIAERYLDDPNSPLRNEALYMVYLEELLRLPGLSEYDRIRPAARLETARKNRPGGVATDFAYLDRTGKRRTLHTTAKGRPLLLVFYDPECGHCAGILQQVGESPVLRECVARQELAVLAVYTEGNRRLWDETKTRMPQEWTVGFDLDSIVERELYAVPAMPVMYLLDGDRRVVLKDAMLPEIERMLNVSP